MYGSSSAGKGLLNAGGRSGAFLNSTTATKYGFETASGTQTAITYIYFNASKSNSIYGSSTTVTPLSRKTKWCIKY